MIVLLKTNISGKESIKKAFIRDRIFAEVNDDNMKIKDGTLKTSDIEGVYSISDGLMKLVPTKDWLEMIQEKSFFGLND